jgi:hydroxyethylthiazole kinase-like uncharacterized protein yjeF
MKILSASQIREIDHYTIAHEPIASIDLMERAADACSSWMMDHLDYNQPILILCGMGNNGGDGWAIARQLFLAGFDISTCFIRHHEHESPDAKINRERWLELSPCYLEIQTLSDLPDLTAFDWVVDAMLGTGIHAPLKGLLAEVVQALNDAKVPVIAIDLPTGLFAEHNDANHMDLVVKATHTLTFQLPKLAFLLPNSGPLSGQWTVLDIQLHPWALQQADTPYYYIDEQLILSLVKPREIFSHKGDCGHVVVVGGAKGKTGAAVLAAKSALRAGAGLCTFLVSEILLPTVQILLPEAMATTKGLPEKTNVLAIGPGMGTDHEAADQLEKLLQSGIPGIVLDADALNLLSQKSTWHLPKGVILTPHPGEFDRLAKTSDMSWREKFEHARAIAKTHQCVVVLKTANPGVCLPDGTIWFCNAGNTTLAKGGSGDVLTGLIAGLLAQGYTSEDAARLGVWLHGKAGVMAGHKFGVRGALASDVADCIGKVFPDEPQT